MKYPAFTAVFLSYAAISGSLFEPVSAYAQTAPVSALDYEHSRMFQAIDQGNVDYIKAHFTFIRSFQAANPQSFFDRKADLNFRDTDGNTPLIRAAMQPNATMVQMLVAGGAELNAVNIRNESALVTSYVYHHYDITQFLLSKGAADPYQVSLLLQQSLAEEKAATIRADNYEANLELAGGAAVVAGIGAAVAAAGGGGGGSGSSSSGATNADAALNPQNLTPSSFLTQEALNQEGIAGMNTQYALARGYDGSIYSRNADGSLISTTATGFVKVAVVDTGIDLTHPDLVGNLLISDSMTCNDSGCVAGGDPPSSGAENWHGTAVAGIIGATRNGIGILGVASQAKIMSIRFADNAGNITNGDTPGIASAITSGAQVINGSYGLPNVGPPSANLSDVQATVNNIYAGTTLGTQYQRGVAAHVIFVYAAGNESAANADIPAGLPYYFQGAVAPSGITQGNYDTVNPSHYDWSKNWVAAVSVNSSNVISSFSNECGVAMNWCLAAPGEISMSTNIGGGYTGGIIGTSFAAPNITGAVAVMLGAFPQLTPEKVLQILFDTATDLGAAGVDAIYGHGLVNLEKATSPTDGGWSLTSLARRSFAFTSSGMALSAPFGNALSASHASLQFFDSYGKNYTIPLAAVAGNLTQAKTDYDRLGQLAAQDQDNILQLSDTSSLQFATESVQAHANDAAVNRVSRLSYRSALPVSGEDREAHIAFHYHMNVADAVMPGGQQPEITGQALKNPYLHMADALNSGVLHYRDGRSSLTMASYFGDFSHEDYNYTFNTAKSIGGVFSEIAYHPSASARIAIDSGMSVEKNSLLGSEASGAFAIGHASTYYTGISGSFALTKDIALLANYHMGLTHVTADSSSLVNGFNTIATNAFAVGAEWSNFRQDNDKLGLVMSQPLRVTQGAAALSLPVDVASNGDIYYTNNALNLAPSGREMDFETYYTFKNDANSNFGLDAVLRLEPNNRPGTNDATLLAKYTMHLHPDVLNPFGW